MSLARGFTQRMKRRENPSDASPPTRSQSVKGTGLQIDRAKISGPVALVSTTNMLSYNAPDIAPIQTSFSSKISTHSADDSDNSFSNRSRASSQASRDTLTDASSVSSSPTSPAHNHLSGYFASANKHPRKSASSGNLQQLRETYEEEPAIPAIPERALSHSKRAHERVAHKRSMQNLSRHGSTRSQREQRRSVDIFRAPIEEEEQHPFGKELEQLNEVAEEFTGVVRSAEAEADLAIIREHNLAMFCAADYLSEIQPLCSARFARTVAPMAWI